MNTKSFWLLLLAVSTYLAPCIAMDTEQKVTDQPLTLDQLPVDVLERILSFVFDNDPEAMGDLARIKRVSKKFEGVLAPERLRFIIDLTQDKLNNNLIDGTKELIKQMKNNQPHENFIKAIQLLIKMGATNLNDALSVALSTSPSIIFDPQLGRADIVLPVQYQSKIFPLIKTLVEAGANPNFIALQREHSPLEFTVSWDLQDILQYFLEHGGIVRDNLLYSAVTTDHPNIVKILLDHGANPNKTDSPVESSHSPLALAHSPEVVRILLGAGAKLYIDCADNTTPLKELIRTAQRQENPSILIEVLKQRYTLETATAIALALMAGASIASAICTIL